MAILEAYGLQGINPGEAYPSIMKFWAQQYLHPHDTARKAAARRRLDLLREHAAAIYQADIYSLFQSDMVRKKRESVLPLAQGVNLISRLVRQLATLYQQPARRRVDGEANNARLHLALRAMGKEHGYNALWAEVQRLLVLCKSLAVGVRIKERAFAGQVRKIPVLDILTPDVFTPIPDPKDPQELLALVLDDPALVVSPQSQPEDTRRAYTVWSATETFELNKSLQVLPGSVKRNLLGRIPYVLMTFEPVVRGLIDGTSGGSLEMAQRAMVFLRCEELHGVRTGVKVPYQLLDGEDRTRRDQVMDKDSITQFINTEAVGTLDLQHEPTRFQQSMQRVEGDVAADHGIPPDIFDQSWTTMTGDAFVAKRASLDEQRVGQMESFRAYERKVLELVSAACALEGDEIFRFSMTGWAIDFGEPRTPQSPLNDLTTRRERRALGLGSPIDDIMELNPDVSSREQAMEILRQRLEDNALWISLARELNISFQAMEASNVEVFGSLEALGQGAQPAVQSPPQAKPGTVPGR